MLRWALICLVIALIAGAWGCSALEGAAMEAARILFFVFLVLFIVLGGHGTIRGRTPWRPLNDNAGKPSQQLGRLVATGRRSLH